MNLEQSQSMSDELITETRPCSDCKHFTKHLMGFPTCKKKLMGVLGSMLVTYKASEGTCFENIDSTESTQAVKDG